MVRRGVLKAEYTQRPAQIARRLWRSLAPAPTLGRVRLPWGATIVVNPTETIGASLWRTGILDLPVSEVIWRLLDNYDVAIDVGANIGYMTCLMSFRTGRQGTVLAFEPHPEIFGLLETNVSMWSATGNASPTYLYRCAISAHDGESLLQIPQAFGANRGVATLSAVLPPSQGIKVDVKRLANIEFESIHLLKIDVEGHELSVLLGAENLIWQRKVRDLVYEDHQGYPSEISDYLERFGYVVFAINRAPNGIELARSMRVDARTTWDAPSYLATNDPKRALDRCRQRGWFVLRGASRQ